MIASVRRLASRLLALARPRPLDADLQAEIASHIEAAVEENLRSGMAPEEARRRALVSFGGVTQAIEAQREARGLPFVDVLLQDLRFAMRTLRRDRALASIVVLVLGLGLGANVAVFSVVNTLLLRPLPFREPGRLVWFATNGGKGGLSEQTYTVSAFEEFQRHNRSFQEVTSFQTFFNSVQYKLVGQGDPLPIVGVQVAGNFFPLLGVQPIAGRLFTPDESRKGGPAAALLSYPFWQRQFGGDPTIVGKTITVNAAPADIAGPVTVVGVLPPSFDFGAVFSPGMQVDFFVPAYMEFWRTWGNTLALLGRLQPGVSLPQAQAESNILFPQLRAAHREWWEDYQSTLFNLQDRVSGKLRRTLLVLWCAVGLMLAIVCINVSNLLLARAISRGREFAMRTALGAGRGRLIRQMLTESLVLASAGAMFGVAVAWGIVFYLARQTQVALPLLATVRIDGTALAWAIVLALSVAVIFGLAPAFRISGANLQASLRDGGPGMSQSRSHERLRSGLVATQVALACVLLIGAGLLLRSFLRILDVDLGFAPARVAAIKIEINDAGETARRGPLAQQILDRVRAIPGIESAAMTDMLPLDRNRSWGLVAKENKDDQRRHGSFVYVVSPGYIDTMGMRLRVGRDISWHDRADTAESVIINEAAARREWPGQDPIGRVVLGVGPGEARVVGVVADVRESTVEDGADAQTYIPITQVDPEGIELVVRTRLPLPSIEPAVLAVLRSLNPGQPRTGFRPLQRIVDHAVSPRRFLTSLVTCFAIFGLLLASLGIYGVISYSVTRQSHEIGIRMALGASAARVQLGVVSATLRLALIGIAIGGIASFAVARAISSLLFATPPADPLTFSAMSLLLAALALLAGYLPARRAGRTDPMAVLRGL
jgi:predicted permease